MILHCFFNGFQQGCCMVVSPPPHPFGGSCECGERFRPPPQVRVKAWEVGAHVKLTFERNVEVEVEKVGVGAETVV